MPPQIDSAHHLGCRWHSIVMTIARFIIIVSATPNDDAMVEVPRSVMMRAVAWNGLSKCANKNSGTPKRLLTCRIARTATTIADARDSHRQMLTCRSVVTLW